MKTTPLKNNDRGFLTLLGLLLAVVVMCLFCYTAYNAYFSRSLSEKENSSEQGLDRPSRQSQIDFTREKIKDINKQQADRAKQLEELF